MSDNVNHPKHYVEASVRVEPIDLLRYAPFDLGCAMKYLIRFDKKGKPVEDLRKALWYLDRVDESCEFNYEPYNFFIKQHAQLIYKFLPYARADDSLPCYSDLISGLRCFAEAELSLRRCLQSFAPEEKQNEGNKGDPQ